MKTYWKISFVRIGMDFRRSITFVTVPSATIDVIRTIQSTSTCPTIGYIRISEKKKKHREITEWIIFGFQFNEKKYQKLTLNRNKLSKIKVEKSVKLQRFCTKQILSPFISRVNCPKNQSRKNSWNCNGSVLKECFRLFISREKNVNC